VLPDTVLPTSRPYLYWIKV